MGNAGTVVRVVSAALMLGLGVGYLTRAGSSEPLKRKPWLVSADIVRSPQLFRFKAITVHSGLSKLRIR
jgi:hypothetical protein